MPQHVIAALAGWPPAVRFMRIAPHDRLLPLAVLLFAVGAAVGWTSVTSLRGCAMGTAAERPAGPAAKQAAMGTGAERAEAPSGSSSDSGSLSEGAEDVGGQGSGEPGGSAPSGDPAGGRDSGEAPDSGLAPAAPLPDGLPEGRAMANLDPDECERWLEALDLSVDREAEVLDKTADAVEAPVLLRGPIRGVTFAHVGGSELHEVIDCRFVLALARWSVDLREAGVRKVEHMSVNRPDSEVRGTGEPSGHSVALAIDAARFELADGRVLEVETDWSDKEHGADPCDEREDEPEAQALLRSLVCDALERDVFQVAITPHHNRAHRNHVHLEIVPDVDWTYVR